MESILKKFKLSAKEIEILSDEAQLEKHDEIISEWDKRYSQVVAEKLKPQLEEEFKEANKSEIFNKQKEAIRKTRKSINGTLALGLTAKDLDELTDEEFNAKVKEHSEKETDTKLKDLQEQYKEEHRLRLEAENKTTEEIEKIKKEFSDKDISREVQLRKARLLSQKDGEKFDKSDTKKLDRTISGAILEEGLTFSVEGDKVFVLKDGQKMRNDANEFVDYEAWFEREITPSFEIKQKQTPEVKLDDKGNPIVVEKSAGQRRLEETYALHAKNNSVHTPA